MFKSIQIKKDYLLITGTVLLLLICYQLTFKKTIDAWQLNTALKSKLAQSGDIILQPGYLERKGRNLDNLIALYKVDTTTLRNNLINTVSLLADKENVKLSEVPVQNLTYTTDHFLVEKLNFDGDFFSLMKLNNSLQKEKGVGVVRSESWITKDMIKAGDRARKLNLEILLEYAK